MNNSSNFKTILSRTFMVFAATVLVASNTFAAKAVKQAFRDGEIIIKYKSQARVTPDERAKTLARVRGATIRALNVSQSFVHAKLAAGKSVADAIDELAYDPNVEYAQPNYIYHVTSTTPNDTYFTSLWGLKNTGQTVSALSAANAADSTQNPPRRTLASIWISPARGTRSPTAAPSSWPSSILESNTIMRISRLICGTQATPRIPTMA